MQNYHKSGAVNPLCLIGFETRIPVHSKVCFVVEIKNTQRHKKTVEYYGGVKSVIVLDSQRILLSCTGGMTFVGSPDNTWYAVNLNTIDLSFSNITIPDYCVGQLYFSDLSHIVDETHATGERIEFRGSVKSKTPIFYKGVIGGVIRSLPDEQVVYLCTDSVQIASTFTRTWHMSLDPLLFCENFSLVGVTPHAEGVISFPDTMQN